MVRQPGGRIGELGGVDRGELGGELRRELRGEDRSEKSSEFMMAEGVKTSDLSHCLDGLWRERAALAGTVAFVMSKQKVEREAATQWRGEMDCEQSS